MPARGGISGVGDAKLKEREKTGKGCEMESRLDLKWDGGGLDLTADEGRIRFSLLRRCWFSVRELAKIMKVMAIVGKNPFHIVLLSVGRHNPTYHMNSPTPTVHTVMDGR